MVRRVVMVLALPLCGMAACSTGADQNAPLPTVAPFSFGSPEVATQEEPAPAGSPTPPSDITMADVVRLPSLRVTDPDVRLSIRLQSKAWQEVAVVQMALVAISGRGLEIDGHYGPATELAVKAFQSRAGIEVDGVVGPHTLRALVAALSNAGGAVPPPPEWTASPTVTFSPPPMYYGGIAGGTVCADNWISTSSGSGTCSWHGGVR